jgi:ribonuclease HI
MLRVIIEADGGSRGNPGNAGYGAVVMNETATEVLALVGEPARACYDAANS